MKLFQYNIKYLEKESKIRTSVSFTLEIKKPAKEMTQGNHD